MFGVGPGPQRSQIEGFCGFGVGLTDDGLCGKDESDYLTIKAGWLDYRPSRRGTAAGCQARTLASNLGDRAT